MVQAANADHVYDLLEKRYGREYSVTLIDGMIKMRKGWSMGADIRMMSGGSMQGPDERVMVTQRSYLDEHDSRIIKRSTSLGAVLGVLVFWATMGNVDTADLTARHAATVQRGVVQFVVGGGMLTGGFFGAACSLFFTLLLNTRTHQAKNKVFVNGMRAWLNERLK